MPIPEDERKRIEEEEEIRMKVRLRFEQKSSGIAGVLSSVCPGLGQMYNGQMGKATLFMSVVLIGLLLLSAGIYFQVKGMPVKGQESVSTEISGGTVEMTEEGVILEEGTSESSTPASQQVSSRKPVTPVVLIIVGGIGMLAGWNYSIKDAISSAKRINTSY